MSQAVDYSFARPSLPGIAAAGYVGVLRYLAYLPNSKVIDSAELADILAAGLAVGFVWEVGTDWTTWDGTEADTQMANLGMPLTVPVYWAVDQDVLPGSYGTVASALDGLSTAHPKGLYGGNGLINYCMSGGHCTYGWVAAASSWSHGGTNAGCNLVQLVGGSPPAGCDADDVLTVDWGQYPSVGAAELTVAEHNALMDIKTRVDTTIPAALATLQASVDAL